MFHHCLITRVKIFFSFFFLFFWFGTFFSYTFQLNLDLFHSIFSGFPLCAQATTRIEMNNVERWPLIKMKLFFSFIFFALTNEFIFWLLLFLGYFLRMKSFRETRERIGMKNVYWRNVLQINNFFLPPPKSLISGRSQFLSADAFPSQ